VALQKELDPAIRAKLRLILRELKSAIHQLKREHHQVARRIAPKLRTRTYDRADAAKLKSLTKKINELTKVAGRLAPFTR
jgi:hypothetical protein